MFVIECIGVLLEDSTIVIMAVQCPLLRLRVSPMYWTSQYVNPSPSRSYQWVRHTEKTEGPGPDRATFDRLHTRLTYDHKFSDCTTYSCPRRTKPLTTTKCEPYTNKGLPRCRSSRDRTVTKTWWLVDVHTSPILCRQNVNRNPQQQAKG